MDKIFIVQKHDTTHLHYDFRLQIGEVLVSWIVPKEPPLKEDEKRLAIPGEDHPLDYANFEGTIPEGEYGAGTVEIWDKGTYENIKRKKDGELRPMEDCLQDGGIEVLLQGKKMIGAYGLIKTDMEGKEKWLLFKMKPKN